MEKREVVRKSTRTVPVIIENHENAAKKTKLIVPSNYTAAHLVNILRSRMHILPYNSLHLFLKSKQSPILMSKSIGLLHHKHQDEKGLLRLIHAEQATFGFRGNIRAIRFRQKWLDNHLHNNSHQEAGGPTLYTGVPPPYFPLDPPSIPHFGATFDVDSIVQNDDYYDFMANSFMLDMEDSPLPTNLLEAFEGADMPIPAALQPTGLTQSTSTPNLSQIAEPNTFEISSGLGNWASSTSLSDPWLPSASSNSSQPPPPVPGSSVYILNSAEEVNTFNLELEQAAANIFNAVMSDNPPPPPSFSVNIHAAIIPPPPPEIPPHLQMYESDSDFYDSDKDLDKND